MMDGAERNRSLDDCRCVFARMWVCTCYLISPGSTAHPVDPVHWERVEWRVVCESVYTVCVGEGVEEHIESSRQPKHWPQFINTFTYTIVFFSGRREEVVLAVYGPLLPPHWGTKLSCITIALPTNLPVPAKLLWFITDIETGTDSRFTG